MLNYTHQEHSQVILITLPDFYHLPLKCYHISAQRRTNHFPQDRINSPKNKTAWTKISHYHVFGALFVHLHSATGMRPCLNIRNHFDERFQTPLLHKVVSGNIGTIFQVTVLGTNMPTAISVCLQTLECRAERAV